MRLSNAAAVPAENSSPADASVSSRSNFRFLRFPVTIVVAGFLVRMVCMLLNHRYILQDTDWGQFEMANIARSLANGYGFSSPFFHMSGPTAWTAPIYPWVLSLVFRVFGLNSQASAVAIITFNSIFAALTGWVLYSIGRRVFDETVGVWAGWIWVVHISSIYFSVWWIWETSLTAFLMTVLFLLTLRMENDDRASSWIGYGLLWGVAALTSTSVLAWLPFSGCWLAYRLHRSGKRFLTPAILAAAMFWICLTPWLVRDYEVFHHFIFVRGDFGVELLAGNNSYAYGEWVRRYHPGNNPVLFAEYKSMGEPAFVSMEGEMAKRWITEHPDQFAWLVGKRIYLFWAEFLQRPVDKIQVAGMFVADVLSLAGLILVIKQRRKGAFLFFTLLFAYPLVYYITFPNARYRHPIDPELLLLAVFAIVSLIRFVRHLPSAASPA